jgi:hypothetical protein
MAAPDNRALALMCRGSYLGIIEFMRDLLGRPISIGTIHNGLHAAAEQASVINGTQDLSRIRKGKAVLAGVCAASTYCYLLPADEHHDADTWGVHLLDAAQQWLKPDYTIADAERGLRAGQKAAWGDTPCHGDVFHIIRQCEGLTNTLSRIATGARSRRGKLEARFGHAGHRAPKDALVTGLTLARQAETRACERARGIRTLIQWLSHDVLVLAGPKLATRRELFDFITDELERLEPEDARRIHPVRVALRMRPANSPGQVRGICRRQRNNRAYRPALFGETVSNLGAADLGSGCPRPDGAQGKRDDQLAFLSAPGRPLTREHLLRATPCTKTSWIAASTRK